MSASVAACVSYCPAPKTSKVASRTEMAETTTTLVRNEARSSMMVGRQKPNANMASAWPTSTGGMVFRKNSASAYSDSQNAPNVLNSTPVNVFPLRKQMTPAIS